MATIFSHPAIPIGMALALGATCVPKPLLWMGIFASILPDFDCISFILDIPYESQFGHRGFTHSIVFMIAFALLCAWVLPKARGVPWKSAFYYVFAAGVSHPLIDMLTDGGHGIALLWPFSIERTFFVFQPIPVSPIGPSFFSARGMNVFLSELAMLWLPCLLAGGFIWFHRRELNKRSINRT